MADRTVLVLGCAGPTPHGRDQLRRLSRQARSRGIRLIGADTPANLSAITGPVAGLVDETVGFDVHDPTAARVWATGAADIAAVLTFRERCVEPVAAIADARGLAGNHPQVAHTIRHKDRCRERLRAAGFAQPRCALVPDEPAARRFLAETGPGPWIVKPRAGLGSAGVSLVPGPESLPSAIGRLGSTGTRFLVETYVTGPEFSAEGVLLAGVPTVLALTAKHTGAGFVETGHRIPARLDAATARLAETEVVRALRAVGVSRGVFHVEFWLSQGNVVLGEIHARAGGDFIHAMVEQSRPGLELYGLLLDDLLGEAPARIPEQTAAAGAEFLLLPAGEVTAVHGWTEVLAAPALIAADLAVRPGDRIGPVRHSADRHGVLVVGGADPDQVDDTLRRLRDTLRIEVRPVC